MAGFSMAEADKLRKAMGKKIASVMAEQARSSSKGASPKGHSEGSAPNCSTLISHFAGYGFNKSHAAGYALVAYQTAWLKAHYPAEYMAALLTSAKRDKDRTAIYLNECRTMGIQVLVPDINRSESDFVARDGDHPVRAVGDPQRGEGVVEHITEASANGPFESFNDFVDGSTCRFSTSAPSSRWSRREHSTRSGYPRKGLLLVLRVRCSMRPWSDVATRTWASSPCSGAERPWWRRQDRCPRHEWEKMVKLGFEKEMLGLYISDHPLFGAVISTIAATTSRWSCGTCVSWRFATT
jgi:DNA polymerase III subunit alpha